MTVFAHYLDTLLRADRRTAATIAERIGVSPTTLSRWRNGKQVPDSGALVVITDVLDLSRGEEAALLQHHKEATDV